LLRQHGGYSRIQTIEDTTRGKTQSRSSPDPTLYAEVRGTAGQRPPGSSGKRNKLIVDSNP
jgi:hypothetical protein